MVGKNKGIYGLIIRLVNKSRVLHYELEPGSYVYIGRAMNGLENRLSRYMKPIHKPHWHIDYLLMIARPMAIVTALTEDPHMEHEAACILASTNKYVPRFGSTDDDCPSHLFMGGADDVINVFASLGLRPNVDYLN